MVRTTVRRTVKPLYKNGMKMELNVNIIKSHTVCSCHMETATPQGGDTSLHCHNWRPKCPNLNSTNISLAFLGQSHQIFGLPTLPAIWHSSVCESVLRLHAWLLSRSHYTLCKNTQHAHIRTSLLLVWTPRMLGCYAWNSCTKGEDEAGRWWMEEVNW